MPTYNFRNDDTGEEIEMTMKISEMVEWKKDNPEWTSFFKTGAAPGFIGSTASTFKNDDGWKENMQRIAEAHPTSALAEKVGGRGIKQSKSIEAAKKRGGLKSGEYNLSGRYKEQ
jgi:hypothetical protein